jgi:hypothetical protein
VGATNSTTGRRPRPAVLYAFIPASFGEKNFKKVYILVVKYANGRKDFRLLRIRTVQYLMM